MRNRDWENEIIQKGAKSFYYNLKKAFRKGQIEESKIITNKIN